MILDRVISSDSHVNVRHDDVKAHLAATFHDDYDAALMEYARVVFGGNAFKANRGGSEIQHASWGRDGHFDPHARLDDMDTDGVDVEVLYCEVSAYRYLYLLKRGAKEATRAFNDTLHDFASADPSRLIVNYQVPIHDIDNAIDEVHRVAGTLHGKSLQLPVFPAELSLADYFDERYDRLFAAISETGLPITCHIGLNTALDGLAQRDPTPRLALTLSATPPTSAEALGIWLLTGIFVRFPELRVVFVEPGLGWAAWYLSFVDDMVLRQGYEFPVLQGELPSFYFHRNMAMTFIDEPDAIHGLRHRLSAENLMWSSDYPHPVSTWPKSLAAIEEQLGSVPDDERALMVWKNAERIWKV
jgi:predicted TIM-barrel fold metal-dependent hydrolase